MNAAAIAQEITRAQSFLVCSHYNPDADAFGSSAGLTLALRSLGKKVVLFNESGMSERYGCIPGTESVATLVPQEKFDAVILCDCATLQRVGDVSAPLVKEAGSILLNIDHHISNDKFGSVNWVSAESSSTSEMIGDLLKVLEVPLTSDIATALFAGLVGDTGSFRYECTSAKTFQLASELVTAGAKPHVITASLFANTSWAATQLYGSAVKNMERLYNDRVAVITVPKAMYESVGATIEDTDPLVERARDIAGVEVGVLIREDGDIWRVSLRSRRSEINVSELAAQFGGGGHKAAAAFRWRKTLPELRAVLLPAVEKILV